MKILLVSSVGGHLWEVLQLAPVLQRHKVVLVVNDDLQMPDFPFLRAYRVVHAERNLKVAWNFLEAAAILERERPDLVLSGGAGPAVPFIWLAKLAGIPSVFVESAAAVREPSMTGRLVYPFVDRFFFQWPRLARFYPRGSLAMIVGLDLDDEKAASERGPRCGSS